MAANAAATAPGCDERSSHGEAGLWDSSQADKRYKKALALSSALRYNNAQQELLCWKQRNRCKTIIRLIVSTRRKISLLDSVALATANGRTDKTLKHAEVHFHLGTLAEHSVKTLEEPSVFADGERGALARFTFKAELRMARRRRPPKTPW